MSAAVTTTTGTGTATRGPELRIQRYMRSDVCSYDQKLCGLDQIRVRQHSEYPNLHLFKYSNLSADFSDALVCECRGVILDADDNWNVVSLPYYKFFNWGEPLQGSIDLSTARVYEKEDGSLMTLYYYKGKWHVSSSGSPDATGIVSGNITFRDLFWRVFKESGYSLPDDISLVYIFELLTDLNKVVVPQPTSRLILHGVRAIPSLEELRPEKFKDQFCVVQEYPFDGIQGVLDSANVLSASQSEGFILVDSEWNRVKIKGKEYIALAHRRSKVLGFTDADILDVVIRKEQAELLVGYPELLTRVTSMEAMYKSILDTVYDVYATLSDKTPAEIGQSGVPKNKWYGPAVYDLIRGVPCLERLAKMGGKKIYNGFVWILKRNKE